MIKAFNKKVRHQEYKFRDLVIKCIILPQGDPRGKWTPTYEGPFVVKNIFSIGAMILTTMDGDDLPHPANADIVKRYYACVIGGSGTDCLTLVCEMSRKQESPPSFIFSNMDRTKAQQNSL